MLRILHFQPGVARILLLLLHGYYYCPRVSPEKFSVLHSTPGVPIWKTLIDEENVRFVRGMVCFFSLSSAGNFRGNAEFTQLNLKIMGGGKLV